MINYLLRLLIITIFLPNFSILLNAQTPQDRQQIIEKTNIQELRQLSGQYEKAYKTNLKKARELAREKGWIIRSETEERTIELQGVTENGRPIYYITANAVAAQTISTDEVHPGNFGYSLDGENMWVGEWDAADVRAPHQEFMENGYSRVTDKDSSTGYNHHSTHVAGTMIAAGVDAGAKGMAFKANLDSYGWGNDNSEMANAASNGLLLSNHSYGLITGWYVNDNGNWQWAGNQNISSQEDYRFGFYAPGAQQWDQIAYNAPYYLICIAANNDRGEGPEQGNFPVDGGDNGYDCIPPKGNAKNILTVGAVKDLPEGYQGNPEDVEMSGFSSWGPADDSRIKPDIVANGVSLYSTSADTNSSYTNMSGTSMAAPSVTGSLLLLQELYYETFDNFMKAATLKALAIHTADEAGDSDGPDYKYGWGLLNTRSAAEVIKGRGDSSLIKEEALTQGSTYTIDVVPETDGPLVATLVWTDLPGTPPSPQLDPTNPMLVNDLDVTVTNSESNNTYYPYKLDAQNPDSPAVTGDNDVDNVEKIVIENPERQPFTIKVDHDGNLADAPQNFSLIVSGIDVGAAIVKTDSVNNITDNHALAHGKVSYEGENPVIERGFVYSTAPDPTINDSVVQEGSGQGTFAAFLTNLMSSMTYYVRAYAINSSGVAYGSSVEFTTQDCVADIMPLEEDFFTQALPFCWQNVDNEGSGQVWQFVDTSYILGGQPGGLPDQLNSSTAGNGYAVLDSRAFGYGSSQDADLISNSFDLSEDSSVVLSFEHQYVNYYSDANLQYSIDNGNTWDTLYLWGSESPPTPEILGGVFSINLSSKVAGETQVRFKWNYSATYDYWWAIDDIQVRDTIPSFYVSTNSATNITSASALLQGSVFVDASTSVTEKGFVYAEHNKPYTDDTKIVAGQGEGNYTSTVQNLDYGTTYFFRAYAKTPEGIAYGEVKEFTTLCPDVISYPYLQDFEEQQLPACWQNNSLADIGGQWQFVDSSYIIYDDIGQQSDIYFEAPSAHNGFAVADPQLYNVYDTLNIELVSRKFNFTGHDSVSVSFTHYFLRLGVSASGTFYYSRDNANTWTPVKVWENTTDNGDLFNKDLSAELAGETDVFFKWEFFSDWSVINEQFWAVDSIRVATSPNTPPQVVNPFPDTTFSTGFTSDTLYLDSVFDDPEGDTLSYTANSSDTSVVIISVNNDSSLIIHEQGTGASTITVTAHDPYGNTVQDSFELGVGIDFEPDIEVIQDQITINEPDSGYIDITNTGTDSLEIYSMFSYDNWLSSDTGHSYSISPGDTSRRHILVSWQDVNTADTGMINIHSNDPQQDTVSISVAVEPQSAHSQQIPLIEGWNIMSLNVKPDTMDMIDIVEPLINDGTLVKVRDESGNSIQYLPWLNTWINSIGDMAVTEGYQIKMNSSDTLSITGSKAQVPHDIPLLQGWNIMGYPPQNPQNGISAVQPLISEGTLVKIQDENGNSIQYLPWLNSWYNAIGYFRSGEGYQIKVNSATTLTLGQGSAPLKREVASTTSTTDYFTTAYEGNPYQAMNIIVKSVEVEGLSLESGDEMAAFDNDSAGNVVCVGAATIQSPINEEDPFILVASMDDPTTDFTDGFIPGNEIQLRIYDESEDQVIYPNQVNYHPDYDDAYAELGTAIADIMNVMTGVDMAKAVNDIRIIPNPTHEDAKLVMEMTQPADVSITLYDQHSRKMEDVYQGRAAGHFSAQLSTNHLPAGIYVVKISIGHNLDTVKVVVQ